MNEPHPDALTDEALTSAMSLASLAADGRYADVNALIVALDPSEYGRLIFAFASLAASFADMYHRAVGVPESETGAALQRTRIAYLQDVGGHSDPSDT